MSEEIKEIKTGVAEVIGTETGKILDKAGEVIGPSLDLAGAHIVTTVDNIMGAVSEAFPEIAGQGFQFYAEYVFASGVSLFLVGTIALLAALSTTIGINKIYKFLKSTEAKVLNEAASHYNKGWPYACSGIGLVVLFVIGLILFIWGIGDLREGIVKMIAPEGVVVKEIISNLK